MARVRRVKFTFYTIPMSEVLERYKQVQPLGMFFAPQNLGMFNSKLPRQAYRGTMDGPVFFCTSEKYSDATFRAWTVRKMDWQTGEIENVGPFCKYDQNTARAVATGQAERHNGMEYAA